MQILVIRESKLVILADLHLNSHQLVKVKFDSSFVKNDGKSVKFIIRNQPSKAVFDAGNFSLASASR